jgi:hypothetical protein
LEPMIDVEVARLKRAGMRGVTHDPRASADIGYRVWNPFEAELRIDAGGLRDEVAKSFARVIDSFER